MGILLITGFDPFGGEAINPAWEAVSALPEAIGPWALHKLRLPVEFSAAAAIAIGEMDKLRPQAVLCVGQAGGRAAITPERVAINVNDASIPDNRGLQPVDRTIDPLGPAAYFTTTPNQAMLAAMRALQIPAQLSNTAGTFVCNDLIYRVLRHIDLTGLSTMAGFIHVPYLPQQSGAAPALPLDAMTAGLAAAISAMKEGNL